MKEIEVVARIIKFNGKILLKMHTYTCTTSTTQLQLLVHKDYKWLSPSRLSTLDWAPADKGLIERLARCVLEA